MAIQLFSRRPSNPVLTAISGTILLILLLFQISSGHVPRRASSFISGSGSSSILDDIFNSTLGFEKIFVIALPTRTDRRDGIVLSAALTNIDFEFVDGVLGKDVEDKSIPSGPSHSRMQDPVIGCWRGHMNAIQMMVQQNLSSVLILEDDADWDIRIKEQMRDLALASHALTQPLSNDPSTYADPTYPTPPDASALPDSDFLFDNLPSTVTPKHSPYGDFWDFLWVGNCGMRFPSPELRSPTKIPRGRVVQHDLTVPQKRYLKTVSNADDVKDQYPDHTRVFHHVSDGICSLGYAITQAGARRLLHDVGLFDVAAPYDILLRQFCEGSGGRNYHNCLTMQPSIFHHHRPAGAINSESDITSHGEGYREEAVTVNVRWSTRMNWDALLDGRTNFEDQFPDI